MSHWIVTIRASLRFLSDARKAQDELNKANEAMNKAAQDLCSKWQGDAAAAFAQEQGVLYQHCSQLSSVGSEYMSLLQQTAQKYEEAEQRATNAIKG